MASRQAVLGMERASFFYGSARVFGGVSFLLDGARTALVGENGTGKSTLLKCLSGELALDAARQRAAGRTIGIGDAARARRPASLTGQGRVAGRPLAHRRAARRDRCRAGGPR